MYYNHCNNINGINSSRRCVFLLLLLILCVLYLEAQQDTIKDKNYTLEFQIFANANFSHESSQQLKFGYDFKRTLIVYEQQLTRNFDFCLAGDTYVQTGEKVYNRRPYLKRAYLQYRHQNLSVSAGLIVLEHFKLQRKIWQLRYVDKTFQSKFNYGDNRNIGILLKHKLSTRFLYDVAITSGYYTPINNSTKNYQFMVGQTFQADFCTFRLFNSISLNSKLEHVFSLFTTKELRKSNLSLEIAKKSNHNILLDENQYGLSVFGNYSFYKSILGFVRYDMNKESITPQAQNVIWAGIQYTFKKHLNASIYFKNKDLDSNFYGLSIFIH